MMSFPLVRLQHDLGRVTFLVVLIGPLAGLQRAFDINLTPFCR